MQNSGTILPPTAEEAEAFIKELEKDPERLQKFAEGITGPSANDPESALYYRKELTYLDKLAPTLKVP